MFMPSNSLFRLAVLPLASAIGLRAKATAMAVPRVIRVLCSAARASGRKGSCWVSLVHSAA